MDSKLDKQLVSEQEDAEEADDRTGELPDKGGAEEALYEDFCRKLSVALGKDVETGRFGAEMKVDIAADGPITIVMDSKVLIKK